MFDTTVHPFVNNPVCAKCGALNLHNADTEYGYKEIVAAGKNGNIPITTFNVVWCPGGKPIEEEKKVATFMGEVTGNVEYYCAGVTEEHLHVHCGRCRYHFLMHPRSATEKAAAAQA